MRELIEADPDVLVEAVANATPKQAEEAVDFFQTMERGKFTPKTRALYYLLIRANVSSRNIKPLLDQICELLGVRPPGDLAPVNQEQGAVAILVNYDPQ